MLSRAEFAQTVDAAGVVDKAYKTLSGEVLETVRAVFSPFDAQGEDLKAIQVRGVTIVRGSSIPEGRWKGAAFYARRTNRSESSTVEIGIYPTGRRNFRTDSHDEITAERFLSSLRLDLAEGVVRPFDLPDSFFEVKHEVREILIFVAPQSKQFHGSTPLLT